MVPGYTKDFPLDKKIPSLSVQFFQNISEKKNMQPFIFMMKYKRCQRDFIRRQHYLFCIMVLNKCVKQIIVKRAINTSSIEHLKLYQTKILTRLFLIQIATSLFSIVANCVHKKLHQIQISQRFINIFLLRPHILKFSIFHNHAFSPTTPLKQITQICIYSLIILLPQPYNKLI